MIACRQHRFRGSAPVALARSLAAPAATAFFFSCLAAAGCSGGSQSSKPAPAGTSTETVVADLAREVMLPTYRDFAARAADLEAAAGALDALPAPGTLGATQAAWRTAHAEWSRAQAFGFGPMADMLLVPVLEAFPPNIDRLEAEIAGADELTPRHIATLGAPLKGFYALEHLLFDRDDGDAAVLARLTAGPAGDRRRTYLLRVAAEFHEQAEVLLAAWNDDQTGHARELATAGGASRVYPRSQDGLDAIVNGIIFAVETAADRRVGRPFGRIGGGRPQPALVEGQESGTSIADLLDILQGVSSVYDGVYQGTAHTGLRDLVSQRSPLVAQAVAEDLAAAIRTVREIPPPLEAALTGAPASVDKAYQALKLLRSTLAIDLVAVLDTTLTFNPFSIGTRPHPGVLARAFAPVDPASAAFFRIALGAVGLYAALRYFARGWIGEMYLEPKFFFSYPGLSWVRPWPGWGMYAHYAVLAAASVAVALGLFYRAAALLFCLAFTYAHFIDKTLYLNHYYLVSWISLLLACLPLNAGFSLNAAWRGRPPHRPLERWGLWALRFQLGVVYFFGGVGKLRPDWLLDAQPLRIWLAARADLPVVGPWLGLESTAYLFSWAGCLFDLTIPFFLLWPRVRPFAYAAVLVFHAATAVLFPIGIFPLLMAALTPIFFAPDWPRRLGERLLGRGSATAPGPRPPAGESPLAPGRSRASRAAVTALLVAYAAFHVLVPLRFLLYPGDVCWTEEGWRFSWRVMVAEKSGEALFIVREHEGGREERVDPRAVLTPLQNRVLAASPEMVLDFAHFLAAERRRDWGREVAVFAEVRAAMNGRRSQPLIDPAADLARECWCLEPARWIVPLSESLDGGRKAAGPSPEARRG